MSLVHGSSLRLRVGDGGDTEVFLVLNGCEIKRFDLTQTLIDSTAIGIDNWSVGLTTTEKRAIVDCTCLGTDENASARIRYLALNSASGRFSLDSNATSLFTFTAFISQYREDSEPDQIKRVRFRLESTGSVVCA